jgi:hypothetical protein
MKRIYYTMIAMYLILISLLLIKKPDTQMSKTYKHKYTFVNIDSLENRPMNQKQQQYFEYLYEQGK